MLGYALHATTLNHDSGPVDTPVTAFDTGPEQSEDRTRPAGGESGGD